MNSNRYISEDVQAFSYISMLSKKVSIQDTHLLHRHSNPYGTLIIYFAGVSDRYVSIEREISFPELTFFLDWKVFRDSYVSRITFNTLKNVSILF